MLFIKVVNFIFVLVSLSSLIHPLLIIGFLAIQMKVVSGNLDSLFYTVLAWKNRYWSLGGRIHYTMLAVAALANSWFLYYWNLIGYKI